MSVLTAIQDACAESLGLTVPDAVFGSTDRERVELAAVANDMGAYVALAYDWQRLKRLETVTGDGTTTSFVLPSDFDRFPLDGNVRSGAWRGAATYVSDHDEWLQMQVNAFRSVTSSWTILGGAMAFNTAPAAGEVLKYYYMSRFWARSLGSATVYHFPYTLDFTLADSQQYGTRLDSFQTDSDGFQLDERLLKLGIIWRWKKNKGLPYEEELADFERLLELRIARDGGPRKLAVGRASLPRGVRVAYPGVIG